MRKLLPLAMAALALPASAQVFNMEQDRVQMAPLDGLMRFHTGDDPRWSEPGFDDSNWPLISSQRDWSAQGYLSAQCGPLLTTRNPPERSWGL